MPDSVKSVTSCNRLIICSIVSFACTLPGKLSEQQYTISDLAVAKSKIRGGGQRKFLSVFFLRGLFINVAGSRLLDRRDIAKTILVEFQNKSRLNRFVRKFTLVQVFISGVGCFYQPNIKILYHKSYRDRLLRTRSGPISVNQSLGTFRPTLNNRD